MFCRDNKWTFIISQNKKFGDVPVLVTEAIAIQEALSIATQHSMDKITIESDSPMVINSTNGLIKDPNQIINHVKDIVNLARNFDNISFTYCNRS